jgi:hypothetical protein
MDIDKTWMRKVRIQTGDRPPKEIGRNIHVIDDETGELITNIFRAVIVLDAQSINYATLSYRPIDEKGQVLLDDNSNPVEEEITINNPMVDVYAITPDERQHG